MLCDAPWADGQKCAPSAYAASQLPHADAARDVAANWLNVCAALKVRPRRAVVADVVDRRRAADGSSSYYIHYHDSALSPRPCPVRLAWAA